VVVEFEEIKQDPLVGEQLLVRAVGGAIDGFGQIIV